ncbi:MAG: hypothetical protein JO257_10230 [Deltaproteobacteria bacterium]|nr:hypothetical protein [Deltaproteobacteria bacterium]
MIRAALALAFVMLAAITARAQSVSPGPLARDHTALEGVDNCTRCHTGGGDAVSPSACLSCHKALGMQVAAKAGFHAQLATDCEKCHADHRGLGAQLVKWPGGRDHFDHDRAGYKLTGRHAKIACSDCHKPAFFSGAVAAALTKEERPRTYLGLSTACVTCHADVHKPSLGSDCATCHDTTNWRADTTSKAFDHNTTRYPLVGAHVKVDCTKCHGGTAQKLANLHPAFDTCKTCHTDPHAGAMGTAATACASCHLETAWKDLHYDRTSHAPRTMPLVGGHAKPTCAACHGDKNDRKPLPACLTCHADPHKPSLGSRCESCHQVTAWVSTAATKVQFHDKTAYPLRGLHITVACDKCHDPKKPVALRYRPIAHGKCLDCHADVHLGQTSKPCEGCHNVDGWKPGIFEVADHAKTRFALDGAHRATPCAKCHPGPPKPPGFNVGNPACETCHADPHAGQFASKGTCASCHDTKAWSPSTFTKEAHAKAGLALTGKHDVACGRCHAKQFVGLSSDCGSCHDDRHAGQFAGRACNTCHAGAEWKPTPGFDHAKTFALSGRHATAQCASCHPKVTVHVTAAHSVESEVYKLGPASHDCIACHRSQHGDPKSGLDQPRRLAAATRACETCHDAASWRTIGSAPTFDHTTTGAPLVGGHAHTACGTCHQPARRKLPELIACSGCHQDRHGGRLGDRCESCHSQASWKQDQLLVDHQRTRLPLVGAHAVQACSSCHKDAQAGTYRGLDPSCRSCHFHTIIDRRPHPDHTKDNGFLVCENCHSVLGWRPAHIDHDKFYPLTGKHKATPCQQCHKPNDQYNAAPTQCIGCHATDETTANGKVPGHDTYGLVCGDCHDTTMWPRVAFTHPQFPTDHHGSTCMSCHTTPNMPNLYTCLGSGCHNSTQDPRPGRGHQGGDLNCARSGCHYGGAHGGG